MDPLSDPAPLAPVGPEDLIAMIPPLRMYARSLTRGSDEADDLVHETLVKAISNIESFKPGTNLKAWLFTILRNSFLNGLMKRSREPVGAADCVSGNVISFPVHDSRMSYNQVMEAIARLPPQYREALILVFLTGESYQEVARICDCAIGTVKSRVSRGRQLLMADLLINGVRDLISQQH